MKAYLFAAPLGMPAFVKNVVHFVTRAVNIYTLLKPLENKNLQMIACEHPLLTSTDRSYLVNSFSTDHGSNQVAESISTTLGRNKLHFVLHDVHINPGNHRESRETTLNRCVVYATFRCLVYNM